MPQPQSSVVDETKQQRQVKAPDYSETEVAYFCGLAQRIERAREQREQKHALLDGMTYTEYWRPAPIPFHRETAGTSPSRQMRDEIFLASARWICERLVG